MSYRMSKPYASEGRREVSTNKTAISSLASVVLGALMIQAQPVAARSPTPTVGLELLYNDAQQIEYGQGVSGAMVGSPDAETTRGLASFLGWDRALPMWTMDRTDPEWYKEVQGALLGDGADWDADCGCFHAMKPPPDTNLPPGAWSRVVAFFKRVRGKTILTVMFAVGLAVGVVAELVARNKRCALQACSSVDSERLSACIENRARSTESERGPVLANEPTGGPAELHGFCNFFQGLISKDRVSGNVKGKSARGTAGEKESRDGGPFQGQEIDDHFRFLHSGDADDNNAQTKGPAGSSRQKLFKDERNLAIQ